MTEEHKIQNEIRIAVSPYCVMFRTNAGDFWQGDLVYSREFGQRVLINLKRVEGLPKGYSDLSGVRDGDGKAVFIEVKTQKGRISQEQKKFIKRMQSAGAIAGVCRSVEDAVKLINGGK